jgi:hypothetical protein
LRVGSQIKYRASRVYLSAVRQCGLRAFSQISPGFARRTLECPRCQRRIIEVIELEKLRAKARGRQSLAAALLLTIG